MPISFKKKIKYHFLLLLLVSSIAFFHPLFNAELISFDDYDYIVSNKHVNSGLSLSNMKWAFTHSHSANWHPLTWISHMIDVSLYGLDGGGHHITNIILHIINSYLIFLLVLSFSLHFGIAICVSILFCFHPMHVESFAWVSERKDLLSTLFMLLAMYTYMNNHNKQKYKHTILLIVYYALALLSKPMVVTFPVLLILVDYWPNKKIATIKDIYHSAQKKVHLFAMSLVIVLITYISQINYGTVAEYALNTRIHNALKSIIIYAIKIIFPYKLSLFYPFLSRSSLFQIIFFALLLLTLVLLAIKYRRKYPWILFGILWFFVSLLPVIGFIHVGSQAYANRYTYIPYFGLFIIIVLCFKTIYKNSNFVIRKGLLFCAFFYLLSMVYITYLETSKWSNEIELYKNSIVNTKNNYFVYNLLGTAYYKQMDYLNAEKAFRKSMLIKNTFPYAVHNLAVLLDKSKRLKEAKLYARKFNKMKPTDFRGWSHIASICKTKKEFDSAEVYFKIACQLNSTNTNLTLDYCETLLINGKMDIAKKILTRICRRKNVSWRAYYNLGVIYNSKKKYSKAIDYLLKGIAVEENNFLLLELVHSYLQTAKYNLAKIIYLRIIKNDPRNDLAMEGLKMIEESVQ